MTCLDAFVVHQAVRHLNFCLNLSGMMEQLSHIIILQLILLRQISKVSGQGRTIYYYNNNNNSNSIKLKCKVIKVKKISRNILVG